MRDDPCDAFLPYPAMPLRQEEGTLSDLTFAVKDLFDVEGYPTSFGQPHVLAASGIKSSNARLVQDLLASGARFVGKTHLVEMAFALTGRNIHFGTPINPNAPDRLPGGSSSGSAAAVAAGLADIGLATDTLGSIRVPASYCGLFGLRPTHGRLSLAGAGALAPSLDTGGWLTRDAETFVRLAETFLPEEEEHQDPRLRLRVPRALMMDHEPCVAHAFDEFLDTVRAQMTEVDEIDLEPSAINAWVETVRVIQGYEAWQAHGPMIETLHPELGPGIRERFAYAATIGKAAYAAALERRKTLLASWASVIKDAVLILPSAPGPAPLRDITDEGLEVHRTALLRQLSLASLFSLPEMSVPLLKVEGLPVGISLIGAPQQDLRLCRLAARIAAL